MNKQNETIHFSIIIRNVIYKVDNRIKRIINKPISSTSSYCYKCVVVLFFLVNVLLVYGLQTRFDLYCNNILLYNTIFKKNNNL